MSNGAPKGSKKLRRRAKKASYYAQQFFVTARNKARRAAKRLARVKKWKAIREKEQTV